MTRADCTDAATRLPPDAAAGVNCRQQSMSLFQLNRDRIIPDVLGAEELVVKQSAVDRDGNLRCSLVAGVQFRPTRPVPHDDGHVTEVARAGWELLGGPLVQVHITTTFAGRIRAWGLHPLGTDRLFVVSGLM